MILAEAGHPESAAVLAGASTQGPNADLVTLSRPDRHQLRAVLARAETDLGADDYRSAVTRGAALSYPKALDTALAVLDERAAALTNRRLDAADSILGGFPRV